MIPSNLESLLDSFPDRERQYNIAVLNLILKGIVRQVASDLVSFNKPGQVFHAIDARRFLKSKTFLLICTALGADVEDMRIEIHRRAKNNMEE